MQPWRGRCTDLRRLSSSMRSARFRMGPPTDLLLARRIRAYSLWPTRCNWQQCRTGRRPARWERPKRHRRYPTGAAPAGAPCGLCARSRTGKCLRPETEPRAAVISGDHCRLSALAMVAARRLRGEEGVTLGELGPLAGVAARYG